MFQSQAKTSPSMRGLGRYWSLSSVFAWFALVLAGSVHAQDHTVPFSTADAGVTRAITNWGLDTCWANYDNMARGLVFMGTNNVNIVRVGFFVDAPLTNNDVTPTDKSYLQTCANLAAMATAATRWDMNLNTSVDAWYISGANTVYPDRWAAAISACQRYYNRSIYSVEGFNEPDYLVNNEGSPQNLNTVFGYLQASNNFAGTLMAGGSTLSTDPAVSWFNPVASRASIGTTHCLAGSAANYVTFLQTVTASNAVPWNPELHNVMEAIMGVQYGLKGGIWWGTAERARGEFVKACQGTRLGYADDLAKWTAAAVYRGTNGAVQAFLGGNERMATTTTYRFFSKDRDVFYDGDGPRRDFTVTVPGGAGYWVNQPGAERVVNINWGADVPPVINGRYIVVNRNSGKVLEVPGASANNGVQLDQNAYTGALNQQWDINPLTNAFGGDFSYFTIKAAHSGVTADVQGGSYANGAVVQQWNGGTNVFEQWILQYTTNGYFKIRTRWCNKVMGVNGGSAANGATILQWDDNGTVDHEWRFIPVGASPADVTAPAVVTGLSAIANPLSIQLNWNASTATDLAGYTVLRSTANGGPYEIVARGSTNNYFTDKSANLNRQYYYVVKAMDRSWNSSGNSSQVSAAPTGAPALVARYVFNGNANDSSINGNHAIVVDGAPAFVAGKYGSAMDFNGADQSTMLPASLLAGVTNFTIGVWVNWDGGAAWQRIFDFGNDTTQYMFLSPSSGSGTLRFAVTTNGGGAEQILQTASPLPDAQWVHVAITRNGSTAKLYTNGVLAASSAAFTIPPASFNPALNYLGKSQYADPLFNGRLDELYIYNYALSDAEIVALANSAGVPPAPIDLVAAPGDNQVRLNWSPASTATSYSVKRASLSGGPYTVVATNLTTACTNTGLANGTTYYFVVSAVNISGESTNSSQVSAMPVPPIPSVPTGLSATAGDARVDLSWAAAAGATSYNVKRTNANAGSYTIVTNVATTSLTDVDLINGSTYYYVVSAVNAGGESGDSTKSIATPSSVSPVGISMILADGTLNLSWPVDHTGWRLQSQTNGLAVGLGTNWFDVMGSASTNIMLLPADGNNNSVFYRLIYP